MSSTSRLTVDGQPLPSALKLCFSTAADQGRIEALFDPAMKQAIDPKSYVVKREKIAFEQCVADGGAAILTDAEGNAHTLTMAWRNTNDRNMPGQNLTEIGTSLTRIAGFHAAHVVIAATALKEWWQHNPRNGIVAEILDENIPSRKVFVDAMQWKKITNARTFRAVESACNANIVSNDNADKPYSWFRCEKNTLAHQAHILLDFMDRGALVDKTRHTIALDLSALDNAGLNRAVLTALAIGVTHRGALKQLAAQP